MYDLYAVCNHSGSLTGGHYTGKCLPGFKVVFNTTFESDSGVGDMLIGLFNEFSLVAVC